MNIKYKEIDTIQRVKLVRFKILNPLPEYYDIQDIERAWRAWRAQAKVSSDTKVTVTINPNSRTEGYLLSSEPWEAETGYYTAGG